MRILLRSLPRLSQRVRLRLMAFITIADTGVISYVSTRNLAERWGFGPLSWMYPLCLDAVAAVGMDLWMSQSPARRSAKWLALAAVALSLAANVVDWLYVGVGAAVLGAVPPLMLAALLLTMHRHVSGTDQASQGQSDTPMPVPATDQAHDQVQEQAASSIDTALVPVPALDKQPVPAHGPRTTGRRQQTVSKRAVSKPKVSKPTAAKRKGPKPKVPDEVVIAELREHERTNEPLSRRMAMDKFDMGTSRADRLMAEARNGARVDLTTFDGNS